VNAIYKGVKLGRWSAMANNKVFVFFFFNGAKQSVGWDIECFRVFFRP
jgi:hypothetical protein